MGTKKNKPSEYYRFEARSTLKQDRSGSWKHKYVDGGTEKTDTTVNIAMSMLTSAAYCDLTAKQRQLYLIAKSQFFGAVSRPATDFPEIEEFTLYQKRGYFYLNHKLVSDVFHLYSKSDHRNFYKDVQVLENHGFIERVTNVGGRTIDQSNKQRTIYRYAEAWKYWKPD